MPKEAAKRFSAALKRRSYYGELNVPFRIIHNVGHSLIELDMKSAEVREIPPAILKDIKKSADRIAQKRNLSADVQTGINRISILKWYPKLTIRFSQK